MGCVNTNSKEFKRLVNKLDVHPDSLELVLYKFINKDGRTPTESEIMLELRGKPFNTSIEGLNLLNSKGYSNTQLFSSLSSANEAVSKINSIFGSNSTSIYRNSKGDYVVALGTPIVTDSNMSLTINGNDTYLNITGNILDVVKNIPWVEGIGRKDIAHRLLYKEHGAMYVTLGSFYKDYISTGINGETLADEVIFKIKDELIRNGINPNALKFTPESGRVKVEPNDSILKMDERLISTKSIETTLNFLESKIPGLSHRVVRDNSSILKKMGVPLGARAFFKNGVVYLIEGKFNEDIAIEECLHPLVSAIKELNSELFSQLYDTAKELFPTLYEEIKSAYDKNSVDYELVTQALSRNVREEIRGNRAKSKWKSLVDKFYNYIKNLFGEILIGNIKPTTTFKELAEIIHSEDGIFNIPLSGTEFHVDPSERVKPATKDYITPEEFMSFDNDVSLVPRSELGGKLASFGKTGIRVAEDITVDEFFDYITGNIKSPISKQKKEVFNRIAKFGYTEEALRNLITSQEDVVRMLSYHEMSHAFNNDNTIYYSEEERASKEYNWMSSNKLSIEEKATIDAIHRLESEKGETLFEQEITNQEQQPIKKENQDYMERSVTTIQQIDNLNNSSLLSVSEVRHIAEQAVFWISDHITELQNNSELAIQIYGEAHKDTDFSTMSRADVVRAIGPDAIIKKCKMQFSPIGSDGRPKYKSRKITKKAEVIIDNWQGVMLLASSTFLNMEDFSIVSSNDGKISEVNTDITPDPDNYNESNDQSDIEENEGSLQEHWQIETRTLDVLATMSQLVRQALMKCYILDENGNKVVSEWGINERINVREATNSILRWTRGTLTIDEMIARLQEKQQEHPWVHQLIERLSDKEGKETDFQSQFFNAFCKHFQSYSIVIEENGVFKSILVNENPALSEAMEQVTTQYKIGEHPLFTSEGVNKSTLRELQSAIEDLEKFNHQGNEISNPKNRAEVAKLLGFISNILGYYVTPDIVETELTAESFKRMYNAAKRIATSIESNIDNKEYNPFRFKSEGNIEGNVREFLKPITDHLEDTAVSAFYDSGKMYQSYVTPSYMSKLMQKFSKQGEEFNKFINEEYRDYPWFSTKVHGRSRWRNLWLEMLDKNSPIGGKNAREVFKHKVSLNFNKQNYMKNMSDVEYTLSMITEYFSEVSSENQGTVPAWYRVPMMSNKPSSEFIRFASFRDAFYKDTLTDGFKMIFDQEVSRIQTVNKRNLEKEDPKYIKNFDSNGKKFNFLDFMNDYLKGGTQEKSELGNLLNKKLQKKLNAEEEARFNELVLSTIKEKIDSRANAIVDNWQSAGLFEGAKKISNLGKTDEEIREKLINFVWNDTFAAMNIIQLTVTDIAYYKDAEDLQKRFAQIHAPGTRGNINATDYSDSDNLVTDGKERTIYLKDFDSFVSNIIENVSIVFDRKIAAAPAHEKSALEALKESLVGKDGAFRKINVADAQGFNSPTSYRKKAFIFGKWSKQAEEVWEKLRKGDYTYSDLKQAFQPLKPFVYSQIPKSSQVKGPLNKLKMGVQNKNSEYLLIMADALLQGEDTGKPNILRAIYQVMEDSATRVDDKGNKVYKNDGIDTVQFASTVKTGLTGVINLNPFLDKENGEALAKEALENAIYKNGQYNSDTVHEIPFEDYCLQQEVPAHFKNHEQAHGSQGRYIIVSELETEDYLGNPVTYNCEGRQLTAEEFRTEYENNISENIKDSINTLISELKLDSLSLKDRNVAISKILQREILSNPRYGSDLLIACSVNEDGEFRIPLGDPIQSKRVEQLLNSIVKNRINKQTIAGGPVVQVSNFGTSRQLNIRFKNKKGTLLKTRNEFNGTEEEYLNYIKENQAGIAYFEVFAPIYANSLFENFQNPDGTIDIEAIEAVDPELLKMVGYRIPTEDKYSMAPLKIVGFLPREAGDGIMLPYDITLLTGSDFDVDKEYLMRKEIDIKPKKRSEINDSLYEIAIKRAEKKGPVSKAEKQAISEEIKNFLDIVDTRDFRTEYERFLWHHYKRVAFESVKPNKGSRAYRNNKIVDMTYEVLTHETAADKVLNPGGFEPQKKMGYAVNVYRNPNNTYSWEDIMAMSVEELKNLSSEGKNLCFIDAHIQFYKQNSAAGSLIGTFAVHRTAHAVLEGDDLRLNVNAICNIDSPFIIAGMKFEGLMPFDMRYDNTGQLIGKVLGSLVGSAADAVKDPVLNLMNINSHTSNILTTLVRMGMPFDTAALFLSQSIITDVLAQHSSENVTGFISLSKIIQDRIREIERDNQIDDSSPLKTEELTYEELVQGIKERDAKINYKTLRAFAHIQKLASALKMPTFATRFNSISSAAGPLIIDNLMTEYKQRSLDAESNVTDADGNEVSMQTILQKHPILQQFNGAFGVANQLFSKCNMPSNSREFRSILDFMLSNGFSDDEFSTEWNSKLGKIIISDRKLLSSLSDFFQSLLIINNETVKSSELRKYITEFPTEFFNSNYKEKYPDNPFIQAIKLSVDKSGRANLQINVTGLDTAAKEKLSNGWIDLHKVNPELSINLFKYAFFRGGIGFNPKTFMGLLPVYVKERIPGYVDSFKIMKSLSPTLVLDQFIRNNWENNRLVPLKTSKNLHLREESNKVVVHKETEVKDMKDTLYFKMKKEDKTILYRQVLSSESEIHYQEVAPLGNNKEYIEISNEDITTPLSVTIEAIAPSNLDSEIATSSNQQVQAEIDEPVNLLSDTEEAKLIYTALERVKGNRLGANILLKKWKDNPNGSNKLRASFISNQLSQLNITHNEEAIQKELEKYC